ncbi:hypothetical protein [Clostridium estertheticum]|nr:hypothetical protein [Clostridium estertheticum]MBU3075592.1 hypothetical protein [Clostridium estertheticum]MBU3164826.1 hypothetical protein [Clostridium estertheticum]
MGLTSSPKLASGPTAGLNRIGNEDGKWRKKMNDVGKTLLRTKSNK